MSEGTTYTVPLAVGTRVEVQANGLQLDGITSGGVQIAPIADGTSYTNIVNQAAGSDITLTLPAATGTLATLEGANAFTGATTFSSTVAGLGGGSAVLTKYMRIPIATLIAGGFYGNGTDAGVTILAAPGTGRAYRVVNAKMWVASGAGLSSTNGTHLRLCSNYTPGATADKIIWDVAKGNLDGVASTAGADYNQMLPHTANNVLLAGGESFTACTANKSIILISVVGVDWTGATNVDIEVQYVIL